jgi:hypothetical protein
MRVYLFIESVLMHLVAAIVILIAAFVMTANAQGGIYPTPWGWRPVPQGMQSLFPPKPPDAYLFGPLAPVFWGEIVPRQVLQNMMMMQIPPAYYGPQYAPPGGSMIPPPAPPPPAYAPPPRPPGPPPRAFNGPRGTVPCPDGCPRQN